VFRWPISSWRSARNALALEKDDTGLSTVAGKAVSKHTAAMKIARMALSFN